MTKGSGRRVLDQMIAEKIVTLRDSMYFLDADRLAEKTGLSYVDCMECRFGERAVDFVQRGL